MSWLTSPVLFYGTLPLSLAAPFLLLWFTARYTATGKTVTETLRASDQPRAFKFRERLEQLLRSGYDRSFIVITFTETDRFLQFRKYIHAKGDYGIELGFPLADWSRDYVPRLRSHLAANGINFTVGPESPGDPMEFLHVDFGKDTEAADRLATAIVTKVFQAPLEGRHRWEYGSLDHRWEYSSLDPFGDLIDSPRQRPPTNSATWKRIQEDTFVKTGMYSTDYLWLVLFGLSLYAGAMGLLHSLIWKSLWAVTAVQPNWAMVALTLPSATIRPPVFDLVCISLILSKLAVARTRIWRRIKAARTKREKPAIKVPRWLRAAGRLLPRHLRLPLILAVTVITWIG